MNIDNDNNNRSNNNSNTDSIVNTNIDLDLTIIGSKKLINTTTDYSLCTDEFEEYDPDVTTVDGILDECIIVDRNNITNTNITTNTTNISEELLACNDVSEMSPELCQKDEMLSIMIDAIWPDVVDALEPLMIRMIKLCREKGIYYDE